VRASDGLITHTLHHRDELCRAWQLPAAAFAIIPHGIAVPADDELIRPATGAAPEVLFVGRFEHRKGIDVLLAAIPAIAAAHPTVRFTLIGHDPGGRCEAGWRAQHPQLAAERVKFLGQVSAARLRLAYRDCDILAAPSRYESFGLIYVEAMAWGKPVVACASGGTVEVVADGETGWLVAPGRADELAARLLDLLRDDARRGQFGRNARLRVQRLFSRTALAARSAAYYRGILAGPRVTV
jgi:glycosyltransferase involved in cell wall biosynthesis